MELSLEELQHRNKELVEALEELKRESDKAAAYMSSKGQGATLLGMASRKAEKVIAKNKS